jgi:hypothetical protein
MVERARELWAEGQTDEAIAAQLTREGFHSARSAGVIPAAVMKIRLRHQWYQPLHRSRGAEEVDGYLTAAGLAKRIGVCREWVYRRLERGEIDGRHWWRDEASGTYRIVNDAALIKELHQRAHGKGAEEKAATLARKTELEKSKRT